MITWTEYRKRMQRAYDAYAAAQRAGERAVEADDARGMVAACRACDTAYVEIERTQGLLLRGHVDLGEGE